MTSGPVSSDSPDLGAPLAIDTLTILKGVAEALRVSVNRHTEIVVHDLRRPESSIVEIVNGHVSDREVGQSLLAGPHNDKAFREIIGQSTKANANDFRVVSGYVSLTRDGRPLQSSSAIFHDATGKPVASLCINVDTAVGQRLQRDLESLLSPGDAPVEAAPDTKSTMDDLITEIVQNAIDATGIPVERMRKQEKLAAVSTMHERGLFLIRGSVELVAKHLGATKFTIYNYLEQLGARTGRD